MRPLHLLDLYRRSDSDVLRLYGTAGDDYGGLFQIPSCIDKAPMIVIASNDAGWDHVSVSRKNRCPNWAELDQVYRLFFRDGEHAMQLHLPADQHISVHPYTLHLWRPHDQSIPLPPKEFVA